MIYLDNSATSYYKPERLKEVLCNYIYNSGNPLRGCYANSLSASELIIDTRKKVARFFGC
ncbi:MAG: aminotransferase class V-fold PLP-dependent enzyme, partial [Streptococcus gallolyticus]|nr:aminotransferase class V-fold PLP-dependent enzyme [Streptococcus gallolyticus]